MIAMSAGDAPRRCKASISSATQRASSSPSHKVRISTLSPWSACVHSVLPSAFRCGDQPRRRAEDVGSGAIIFFEPYDLRAGKIFLKTQDVADFRAAPAIDGLILIADDANVFVFLREQAQPQILRDVRVLIFIHQKIVKAVLVLFEDIRIFAQQSQLVQKQIAEVAGVQLAQALLIKRVELRKLPVRHSLFRLLRLREQGRDLSTVQ